MQIEDIKRFKRNFLFSWFIANAIGLSFGWVIAEWLGLQVAEILGWNFGQIVGFIVFEGVVWAFRWTVLSRVRTYDTLKAFDIFFWVVTEMIVWFGIESSNRQPSYNEESLFGIVSTPILSNFLGAIGWLILWLIKTQVQKSRLPQSAGRSLIASSGRVGGSLFIFIFLVAIMPISTSAGEAMAKISNWVIGRAVAGALLGGLLSLLTGLAILSLLKTPSWDE
jgi:hypothetical protein